MSAQFQLSRNAFQQLVLIDVDGAEYVDVRPVRAFPIQSPDEGISLVRENGVELAWIERLADLPPALRTLISDELEGRELMPVIATITSVTSFATPCTWQVETDRGSTAFVLKGDEDIRRVGKDSLLISDNHGIHFLIRDMYALDKNSRKILDRFL